MLWFSRKGDSRSFLSIYSKKLQSSYLEFYQPIFFCFLFFGKNRLDSSHVFSPFSFFSGWSIDLVFSIFITIFFREGEIVWLMDGSLVAVFFISSKNQWIFQRHYLFFVSLLIFQNSFLFIIKCTSFVRYCLFSKFKLYNSFQYLLFFQDFFQIQFIN